MPYSEVLRHVEPFCTDINNGCVYEPTHRHGLECEDCRECNSKCHPSCPAYSIAGKGNAAFEAFLDGAVDGRVAFVIPIEERTENG